MRQHFALVALTLRALQSRGINARQAKDFLINQTVEQASLDGVPLSEKRMMYFTESDDSREDPMALNEEFEAQSSSDEYELKIARLLKHAYSRVKKG